MVSDQEIIRVVLEGMTKVREGKASLDSAGADAFRELYALGMQRPLNPPRTDTGD